MGVVQALLDDLKNNYVQSLVERVHADTFSNFLDMAQHLSEAGYKDAAAVIAGSAPRFLGCVASATGAAQD